VLAEEEEVTCRSANARAFHTIIKSSIVSAIRHNMATETRRHFRIRLVAKSTDFTFYRIERVVEYVMNANSCIYSQIFTAIETANVIHCNFREQVNIFCGTST